MSRISEKVAYLEGLVEGLEIKDDKSKKVYDAIIDTLHVIADEVAEHDVCINDICDSLEEEYYDDEYDDEEDTYYEIVCPACGETIYFDAEMLDSEEGMICPHCNEPIDIKIPVQPADIEIDN